jgi:hypothetical protein
MKLQNLDLKIKDDMSREEILEIIELQEKEMREFERRNKGHKSSIVNKRQGKLEFKVEKEELKKYLEKRIKEIF